MMDLIRSRLSTIEKEYDVTILYACEAGSRAWGFESPDSDFDVRFLYLHRPEHYLAIDLEKRRDVIELPITDHLDINGWDLRKALQLFRKSNPPLLEWLQSTIVYKDEFSAASWMRDLIPAYYRRTACRYHYFSMAKGNYRDYLQGDPVWLKKYLYVLRPLLALIWLEESGGHPDGFPPLDFQTLVQEVLAEKSVLRREIMSLLEEKKAGAELAMGPKIPEIDNFIFAALARLEREKSTFYEPEVKLKGHGFDWLNELFTDTLLEVYNQDVVTVPGLLTLMAKTDS